MKSTGESHAPLGLHADTLFQSMILEMITLAVIVPEAVMFTWPQSATVAVPLLVLVPILFSIRYGFLAGMSAALILTSILFQLFYFPPHVLSHFPKVNGALYLLAAGITGHFHDHWIGKLRATGAVAELHRQRLAQFTTRFHLLQASHTDLERHVSASRTSLRASMQRLKEQLACAPENGGQPFGGIGMALLEVLAEPCHVLACAVYDIKENGAVASTPAASMGAVIPLAPTNPLLREALDSASVVSVRADDISVGNIIAVVPLVDALGRIHGVVTINQISFIALHQHTFDLMAVIARHAANILSGHTSLFANPGDTRELLACLRYNLHMAQFERLQLAIVILRILAPTRPERVVAQCLEVYRDIDRPWLCRDNRGHLVLVMLMPVHDDDAARGQIERLRKHLTECAGPWVATDGVQTSITLLPSDHDVQDAFAMTLRACDVHVPHSRAEASATFRESVS